MKREPHPPRRPRCAGRLRQETDRFGRTRDYGYDSGDRVTSEVWKSAAGVTVNLLTYAYDANDNRTLAQDYSGTVTYTFDELDRVRTYANVFGQALTYTYDAEGRVTKREDSLAGVLTSVYDAVGRLTSRQFGGSGQTPVRIDMGYTNRDELSSKTWYTDLAGAAVLATSAYAYDDAGRLTGITNKNASAATLSYYNYTHDNADRVSTHTWWSQVGTVTYSGTNTYAYDTTNQLTNDGSAYSYDLGGNRTMSGYQTGTANRLSNDGTFTYTYDAAGNITQRSKGTSLETWYYGYDHDNRQTSVRKTSDGSTNLVWVTYTYDVEGKRVKEEEWVSTGGGAGETRFAYDGEHVWADLSSANVVLVRRTFGDSIDQLLTRVVASGPNAGAAVYFTDHLGSVRALVDSTGSVKDHLDYSGFGVATESHSTVGDRYGFTGREENDQTGVRYYRLRVIMVGANYWMNEDPNLLDGNDANLLRYSGNNPTNPTYVSYLADERLSSNDAKRVMSYVTPGKVRGMLSLGGVEDRRDRAKSMASQIYSTAAIKGLHNVGVEVITAPIQVSKSVFKAILSRLGKEALKNAKELAKALDGAGVDVYAFEAKEKNQKRYARMVLLYNRKTKDFIAVYDGQVGSTVDNSGMNNSTVTDKGTMQRFSFYITGKLLQNKMVNKDSVSKINWHVPK